MPGKQNTDQTHVALEEVVSGGAEEGDGSGERKMLSRAVVSGGD